MTDNVLMQHRVCFRRNSQGSSLSDSRTPSPLQIYNVVQIALNIYMIWGLTALVQLPFNIFGINQVHFHTPSKPLAMTSRAFTT